MISNIKNYDEDVSISCNVCLCIFLDHSVFVCHRLTLGINCSRNAFFGRNLGIVKVGVTLIFVVEKRTARYSVMISFNRFSLLHSK